MPTCKDSTTAHHLCHWTHRLPLYNHRARVLLWSRLILMYSTPWLSSTFSISVPQCTDVPSGLCHSSLVARLTEPTPTTSSDDAEEGGAGTLDQTGFVHPSSVQTTVVSENGDATVNAIRAADPRLEKCVGGLSHDGTCCICLPRQSCHPKHSSCHLPSILSTTCDVLCA